MSGPLLPAAPATALDAILAAPRLRDTDSVDLSVHPEQAWPAIRHGNLAGTRAINTLFAIRRLPARLTRGDTAKEAAALAIDDLRSTPARPGFQVLADNPPHEVAVGAIGKVWRLDIPFVHVNDAQEFAAFSDPDFIKVAWAIRLTPLTRHDTRVTIELRAGATDDAAWRKFRRYFLLIGPASRFIRRSVLSAIASALGGADAAENGRPLPGDDLLPDAAGQLTHAVTIRARPADIWPWLVQMGCRRGGFYSIDLFDNGVARSAREIHPELQQIAPGDVLPATPEGEEGFEVLRVSPPTELILGGLFDRQTNRQFAFDAPRPAQYWQLTWAFVLEPRTDATTRLHVRARASFPADGRLHVVWLAQLHHLMQSAQLRHVAARAEGRLRRDDWRDIAAGTVGATRMAASLMTPQRRAKRARWGMDDDADRYYPGDDLVPRPRWSWTHGVEVEAPAGDVWPWVAQIGAGRAGFYSYQWLENLAGCDVRNAESIHPEWAATEGGELSLHPQAPPLRVVSVTPGRSLVAFLPPRPGADKGWIAASWLFHVEPLGQARCRVISRYRCVTSCDLMSRLRFGPGLTEPIAFAMDRQMLLGIKQRAEQARDWARTRLTVRTPASRRITR